MRESVIIDLVVVVSFREVGRIIVSLLFTLRVQSSVLLGERHAKQASRVSFSPTCARLADTRLVLLLRDGVDVAAGRCPSLKDWLGGDILHRGFSAPNHILLVLQRNVIVDTVTVRACCLPLLAQISFRPGALDAMLDVVRGLEHSEHVFLV